MPYRWGGAVVCHPGMVREALKSDGLPRFRAAGHLRHGVVSYVWLVGVLSAFDASAIWANPNVMDSMAYSWAGNLAPWWTWSGGFGLVAVLAAVAVWKDHRRACPSWLVAATLGAHGVLCSAIGASIAWLYLDGVHTAIMGAGKWLAFTAGALWFSRQQTLFERSEWAR